MEIIMKKSFSLLAALLLLPSFGAGAQESISGTVSYALPQTALVFEVEAVQEKFYAGPYAKYAQKYLGIEAKTEDSATYNLSSVRLRACVEADQSARYTIALSKDTPCPAFVQMTAQGLVALSDGNLGEESVWRFAAPSKADFSGKGVSSNYTSESATLYRNVKDEQAYNKVAIQQNMVVEKSLEKKAKEAADMIFNLRRTRVQIVTGDTDANYSGDAMASALAELERLEQEYMSLFIGYSEYQNQTFTTDYVPDPKDKNHIAIAFRISDTDGVVDASDVAGKPYFVQLEPQSIKPADAVKTAAKVKQTVPYRIPAICTVKLLDGAKAILQTRVPVYQLGVDTTYPIY